jgi:hypothetical protein
VNGPSAVHSQRVDVRAAPQPLVDRVDLSHHRCPVDRLVGPLVALADELRLRVEQLVASTFIGPLRRQVKPWCFGHLGGLRPMARSRADGVALNATLVCRERAFATA